MIEINYNVNLILITLEYMLLQNVSFERLFVFIHKSVNKEENGLKPSSNLLLRIFLNKQIG